MRASQRDATGPLCVAKAHAGAICALAVVADGGAPLIVSAGREGALRSWRRDGTPGALTVDDAHQEAIFALVIVEDDGAPLIVSAGHEGALRSWRLDGTPGALTVNDAHQHAIRALVVVEYGGAPLIVSAGHEGALRSWRVDGTPGALTVTDAHQGMILAFAVVEDDGAPLIVSAGGYRALRSWRLDGTPGALTVDDAHHGPINALVVLEDGGAPLIVAAGHSGALRSWSAMQPRAFRGPRGADAAGSEARRISLAREHVVTATGREEAHRMRRLEREGKADAALGRHLPKLVQPWMPDAQKRAVLESLGTLRAALDGEQHGVAIGAAKDLAEAACKVVIERAGGAPPRNAPLPTLLKVASAALPADRRSDGDIVRSLAATVQRLAELRNTPGAGHGRAAVTAMSGRHARLATSAATGIADFLLSPT